MRCFVVAGALADVGLGLSGCKASPPGGIETKIAQETKELTIGGKDWANPMPDDEASRNEGSEHFRHHCQICHGLDGQNTGVPFAEKMSPPVADLAMPDIQKYSDGQLKWIVQNGIKMTGMPGWQGILDDDEMWKIVRYLRHLPPKGSTGIPEVYRESDKEHHTESTEFSEC
jgi:mono/diheme cytochrome c family protein